MPNASRTLQACKNCRRKKIKCTGVRPACRNCLVRKSACQWPEKLIQGGYSASSNNPIHPEEPSLLPGSYTQRENTGAIDAAAAPIAPATAESGGFPPSQSLDRLLEIFWQRHHDVELCSFLHRSSFEVEMIGGHNAFILCSIITLSSLYISDVEARLEFGFQSARALSDHYVLRGRELSRHSSDEPTVTTIQANLILGLRELLTMTDCKAWMYVGLAIRMAQALRMRKEYNQRYPPRQREIRRRTFWACVTLDRLVAFCTFRTQAIETDLISIHLPCTETAFAFDQDAPGPLAKDMHRPAAPASQLGVLPYFIASIMLWGDMGAHYVNRGRRDSTLAPSDHSSDFYKREMAMRRWACALPPEMLWSPQNLRAHQSLGQGSAFVNMHFLVHHALCVAHQEYLPHLESTQLLSDLAPVDGHVDCVATPDGKLDEMIVTTCLRSADSIVRMVRQLSSGRDDDRKALRSTLGGLAISSAASVYLWLQYSGAWHDASASIEGIDFTRPEANFNFLLETLQSWRCHWKLAQAWSDSLEFLSELYHTAYNEPHGTLPPSILDDDNAEEVTEAADGVHSTTNIGDEPSGRTAFRLREGDGLPDASTISQSLYYKVRLTVGMAMENKELCRRIIRMTKEQVREKLWMSQVINYPEFFAPDSIAGIGGFSDSDIWGYLPVTDDAGATYLQDESC